MKKIAAIIGVMIVILFSLSACGKQEVSQSTIQVDVENYSGFSVLEVDTNDFEIIKRKTDIKNRIDEVYISIKGENKEYSLSRNYYVIYELYNDGWKLERIEPFYDDEYPTYTTPLIYPSISDVEEYLETVYFLDFKVETDYVFEINCGDPVIAEQTEKKVLFDVPVTYQYFGFNQTINLTVISTFTEKGDGTWGWLFDICREENPSVKNTINDKILGLYKWENSSSYITINIKEFSDYECVADVSYSYFSPWYRDYGTKTGSFTGHFKIEESSKYPSLILVEDIKVPHTNDVATLSPSCDESYDGDIERFIWWCGSYEVYPSAS